MSGRIDLIDILCPRCKKQHRYQLEVQRSIVMYHVEGEERELQFTRIFICPETKQKFQASLVVVQHPGEIIHDVSPGGISEKEAKPDEEKRAE